MFIHYKAGGMETGHHLSFTFYEIYYQRRWNHDICTSIKKSIEVWMRTCKIAWSKSLKPPKNSYPKSPYASNHYDRSIYFSSSDGPLLPPRAPQVQYRKIIFSIVQKGVLIDVKIFAISSDLRYGQPCSSIGNLNIK